MTIFNIYSQLLGVQQFEYIAKSIGTSRDEAVLASAQVVPILVSAMARFTRSESGAKALSEQLDRDHDGSILMRLPTLYGNPSIGNGDAFLDAVLGSKRGPAEALVAQGSRVSENASKRLFVITVPILLGLMGMKKRQDKINASMLAQMLNHFAELHEHEENSETTKTVPSDKSGFFGGLGNLAGSIPGLGETLGNSGGLGSLGDAGGLLTGGNFAGIGKLVIGLLDRDKDGSVIDDITGMAGGLLGGKK